MYGCLFKVNYLAESLLAPLFGVRQAWREISQVKVLFAPRWLEAE